MSVIDVMLKADGELIAGVNRAKYALGEAKRALDAAVDNYSAAENALYDAELRKYNARKAVIQDYIDNVVMKIAPPESYSQQRVDELRAILKKGISADSSYEEQVASIEAFRELQLTIEKFPIARRVAETIREWTGNEKVKVSTDGKSLAVGKRIILSQLRKATRPDNLRESQFRQMAESRRRNFLMLFLEHGNECRIYTFSLHSFWEMTCAELPILPELVVGPAPTFDFRGIDGDKKKDAILEERSKFRAYTKKVSWVATSIVRWCNVDVNSFTDEDVASMLIAYNPGLFTVKEIMKTYPNFKQDHGPVIGIFRDSQSHVDIVIQKTIAQLQRGAAQNIEHIKFDPVKMVITWDEPRREDSDFDMDTCMPVLPGTPRHTLDVSNVPLADIYYFARMHIEGMKDITKESA